MARNKSNNLGVWRAMAILLGMGCVTLLIALIVVVVQNEEDKQASSNSDKITSDGGGSGQDSFPCPPKHGGIMTSGDPQSPGPFHDVTSAEYERLTAYLKQKLDLNWNDGVETYKAFVFTVDLLLPRKTETLSYLNGQGRQPTREARVMIFRGDLSPPVVEEYRVGPLSNIKYANLIVNPKRRNPVEFSLRPYGLTEFGSIKYSIVRQTDDQLGPILQESFGGKFYDCGERCLLFNLMPEGTQLYGSIQERRLWLWGYFNAVFYTLHPVDFGLLINLSSSNSSLWSVEKVWYAGALFDSIADFTDKYKNDPNITKIRIDYQHSSKTKRTTLNRRGDPTPETPPRRPPMQIEPDGKRYTIQHRHVKYLHWDFDLRMSTLQGPQLFDIQFAGERIAYEISLQEIAVFYSGNSPMQRTSDLVDSFMLLGTHAHPLVPGADCPESASFLDLTFLAEGKTKPTTVPRAICVFEQSTGVPLTRHMGYSKLYGSKYGGLLDSVLTVRSIIVLSNYDYIVDFIFHQSGAIETRTISSGYILSTAYSTEEAPYGFRLAETVNGNLHHHMFNYKVDLDIGGTSNRYETLDIGLTDVPLPQVSPQANYKQIKFDRHLYNTEEEAVFKYNFDHPKYHLVHNNAKTSEFGVPRAYRLHSAAMSKQLLPENLHNEPSISWARQQLAVTVHSDDEFFSSSPYAGFDSLNPVTNFSNFISDESIVDKDLVFWVSIGTHHIPRAEDFPTTPTPGGHLSFFLLPYNYFQETPSMMSHDLTVLEYATAGTASDGVSVEQYGQKQNGQCGAVTLQELALARPQELLQTDNEFHFA